MNFVVRAGRAVNPKRGRSDCSRENIMHTSCASEFNDINKLGIFYVEFSRSIKAPSLLFREWLMHAPHNEIKSMLSGSVKCERHRVGISS